MPDGANPNKNGPMNVVKDPITNDDLWMILSWRPTSPQDRAKILFGNDAVSVWDCQSTKVDTVPSQDWIEWAKSEIQSAEPERWKYTDPFGAVLYFCRVMRLLELLKKDSCENIGIQMDVLRLAFASGLVASGFSIVDNWGEHLFTKAGETSMSRGMLVEKDRDDWQSGMESGTGRRKYYQLSFAGKHLAASVDKATPPEVFPPKIEPAPRAPTSALPVQLPSKVSPWFEGHSVTPLAQEKVNSINTGTSTELNNGLAGAANAASTTPTLEGKLTPELIWKWHGSEAKLHEVAEHLGPLVGKAPRTIKEWSVKYSWAVGATRPDDRAQSVRKEAVFRTLEEMKIM